MLGRTNTSTQTIFQTVSSCENNSSSLASNGVSYCMNVYINQEKKIPTSKPLLNSNNQNIIPLTATTYETVELYAADSDNDGVPNCIDLCPDDILPDDDPFLLAPNKQKLTNTDGCFSDISAIYDACPDDDNKHLEGVCGCGKIAPTDQLTW